MATASALPGVDVDVLLWPLATGPCAMIPATDLAALWGLEPEASLDTCADLEADGWVSSWDAPDGTPRVILTPLAAERLSVELHPTGADAWDCVWRPVSASWRGVRHDYRRDEAILETDLAEPDAGRHGVLDSIPDPRSLFTQELELELHGSTLLWHGPDVHTAPTCPGCAGHPCSYGVCLCCARHGNNVRVGPKDPKLLASRAQKSYEPPKGVAGGKGKAKAKGKPPAVPKKIAGYRASRPRKHSFDLKTLATRVGA